MSKQSEKHDKSKNAKTVKTSQADFLDHPDEGTHSEFDELSGGSGKDSDSDLEHDSFNKTGKQEEPPKNS